MGMIYERGGHGDESNGDKWNRVVGPFYSHATLSERLQITPQELQQQFTSGQLLALRTKDGQIIYPTRQFFANEDGKFMVNPAVPIALQFLIEHESEFADIRNVVTDDSRTPLISEWTIAAALLQVNENGRTLIEDLHQHLQDRTDDSWNRLLTLNGMASGLRQVLNSEDSNS